MRYLDVMTTYAAEIGKPAPRRAVSPLLRCVDARRRALRYIKPIYPYRVSASVAFSSALQYRPCARRCMHIRVALPEGRLVMRGVVKR